MRFIIAKDTDDGVIAWDGHFDSCDDRQPKVFTSFPETQLRQVQRFYNDTSWFIARVK